MNENLLVVSTSPHLLGRLTLRSMHLEIMLAMTPAFLVGLYYFGLPALSTVVLAVAGALASDYLIGLLTKKPARLEDLHTALMGFMMGMILAPGAPWWLCLLSGALAVTLGKLIFGGLGSYPLNPVLVAWAAMSLSWSAGMNHFLEPLALGAAGKWTQAQTPLMQLKGDIATLAGVYEMKNLWLGAVPAAVGAGSSVALLAGGIYLIIRRLIPWQIPLGVLLGAVGMVLLATYTDRRVVEMGLDSFGARLDVAWFHLATGGLMISAFFLGPEPVTSPVTPWGTFLFGLGIGIMTIIVRSWGSWVDGAYYGVMLMNLATPLLDRIRPRVLGKVVTGA
ncbi:MAG: RnfABCDGE type electron transport complex subunit D [Thermodesulfobacteriota bacterium]